MFDRVLASNEEEHVQIGETKFGLMADSALLAENKEELMEQTRELLEAAKK